MKGLIGEYEKLNKRQEELINKFTVYKKLLASERELVEIEEEVELLENKKRIVAKIFIEKFI